MNSQAFASWGRLNWLGGSELEWRDKEGRIVGCRAFPRIVCGIFGYGDLLLVDFFSEIWIFSQWHSNHTLRQERLLVADCAQMVIRGACSAGVFLVPKDVSGWSRNGCWLISWDGTKLWESEKQDPAFRTDTPDAVYELGQSVLFRSRGTAEAKWPVLELATGKRCQLDPAVAQCLEEAVWWHVAAAPSKGGMDNKTHVHVPDGKDEPKERLVVVKEKTLEVWAFRPSIPPEEAVTDGAKKHTENRNPKKGEKRRRTEEMN